MRQRRLDATGSATRPKPAADPPRAPTARPTLKVEQRGIYEIAREPLSLLERLPLAQVAQDARELRGSVPALTRLAREVWAMAPGLLILTSAMTAVESMLPAGRLYVRKRLLDTVQTAIDRRVLDQRALVVVLFLRLALVLAGDTLRYYGKRINGRLELRLKRVFDRRLFEAKLRLDLPALSDEGVRRELALAGLSSWSDPTGPSATTGPPGGAGRGRGGGSARGPGEAFSVLQTVVRTFGNVFELFAELGMLASLVRSREGNLLIVLVALPSLLLDLSALRPGLRGNYWSRIVNADSIRASALRRIALGEPYAGSVIANGAAAYLTEEYDRCQAQLDRVEPGAPRELYSEHPLNVYSLVYEALTVAPMAAQAPLDVPITFASWLVIDESSRGLSRRLTQLAVAPTQLSYAAGRIRGLYEAGKIERRVLSGPRIYEPGRAPSIEFRNVSFTYPGASRPSLVNVSFIVGAGEACTIVGHNASGKTTLCKLLARLWDPDSGVILLDGVDTREYDPSSLQRAIGLHLQDPPRFPLSIAESIALGNVHVAPDADAIRRAARLAGAEAYIDSLPRGFASSLDKPQLGSGNARSNRRGADMPAFMAHGREDQERWLEMSGGQKSKLALAGFMTRLETSDILILDEPSAALDARAERDLFRTLLDGRNGATLIMITHRLGLATLADRVIMLDDARVVAEGSHAELMAHDGPYASLFRSSLDAPTPLGR